MNWDDYFLKTKGMKYSEWIKTEEYIQRERVGVEDLKAMKRFFKWCFVLLILAILAYNNLNLGILGGAALIAFAITYKEKA